MNRLTTHRYITTLTIAFVTLACFYVGFLAVNAWMLARDRADCKQRLQDNTTRGQEYQSCTRLLQ